MESGDNGGINNKFGRILEYVDHKYCKVSTFSCILCIVYAITTFGKYVVNVKRV